LLHSIVEERFISVSMYLSVYSLESCIPEIPSQGTVGASGDLAPLAHLAAGRLNKKESQYLQ
jgi:histidine ammonia-lyase